MVRHGGRRSQPVPVCRGAGARKARTRHAVEAAGRADAQRAPQRRARGRTGPPQHPLRQIRRPEVPRSGAREGRARAAALHRQPAQSPRRFSHAAVAAGHRPGDRRSVPERAGGRRLRDAVARELSRPRCGRARLAAAGSAAQRTARVARMGRTDDARQAVVRTASTTVVRCRARSSGRSGATRTHRHAVTVARTLHHRTDARPAAGDRR